MKPYTIAYVSGTRADFGLMTPVLRAIKESPGLRLRLYATGMHGMAKFGSTIRHMRRQFPRVIALPATFVSDDRRGAASFYAQVTTAVANEFRRRRPDFVLTLGDRSEMLAVAAVCLYLGIPSGHIHGGEITSTVDGVARHAITKLSHLHFAATAAAARRIKLLGEEPWRIYRVGAPGIDVVKHQRLPSSQALRRKLRLPSKTPLALVTLHPVSEDWSGASRQMRLTLAAAATFPGHLIVIYPNADPGGRRMIAEITKYRTNDRFHVFPSLDYQTFLAVEREVDVWIGNSSAGMIESMSWPTPVINVGPRQAGREHGRNVITVPYRRQAIVRVMHRVLTDRAWRRRMADDTNHWGDGRSGRRIARILAKRLSTPRLLSKRLTYA